MELKKERTTMKVAAIDLNEGQWPWLPKNPRQWTQTDIDKTAASIEEDPDFLEDRPLLVIASPEKGRYIAFGGNLRLTACRHLKMADVPVMVYQLEEFGDPAVRDVIRETIKRRAMKDNGSFGSWDFDELANNWDDLPLDSWGVPSWPAPENPIQAEGAASGTEGSQETKKVEEDNFDEAKDSVQAQCQPGDIWQLGEHRLLCGDSTKIDNYQKLLEGKEARLCVTSPPYGVGKSYEEYGLGPWKETIFPVIENITKHARIVVWNIGDLFATGNQFIEPTSMYSTQKMKECGFNMMYARIWKKQGGNFAGTNPYYTVSMKPVQEYEWILGYAKRDYERDYAQIIRWFNKQALAADLNNAKLREITGAGFMYGHWFTSHQFSMMDEKNYIAIQKYCRENGIAAFEREYEDIRREYDNLNIYGKILSKEDESDWGQWAVWNISTVSHRTGDHPAEFPVELPARCIKMHSRPGDAILDPFCGAGTTLIAAEQLGRICYGIELDPHYCDIIIARWEKLTGNKAAKLTT